VVRGLWFATPTTRKRLSRAPEIGGVGFTAPTFLFLTSPILKPELRGSLEMGCKPSAHIQCRLATDHFDTSFEKKVLKQEARLMGAFMKLDHANNKVEGHDAQSRGVVP